MCLECWGLRQECWRVWEHSGQMSICAGDSGGTVEAGVQRGEARGRGTNQKRRQRLMWRGSGHGRESRVQKMFRIPILLPPVSGQ